MMSALSIKTCFAKWTRARRRLTKLKQLIVDKLATTYDGLARRSEDEFAKGLQVGKLVKRAIPFLRDKDTRSLAP